jgi:hypothetical protein
MSETGCTLHRLIYAARCDIRPGDLPAQLEAIEAASALHNRLGHVTSLLLAHQGWFLQALEGPAEQVLETYRRIAADKRCHGAKVLFAGPAILREFADWNLCVRTIGAADQPALAALGMGETFQPLKLSGRCALTLLKAVRASDEPVPMRAAG